MVFCLVGDKVPCKDSKGSKIVPIWSKKTKEVFMLLFSCFLVYILFNHRSMNLS